MNQSDNLTSARCLMIDFADRTGLSSPGTPPRRYLWTDAFAVCNFLGLYRQTGLEKFRELAVALIGQVHETLGRHRCDDNRRGWISGLPETEGLVHPTVGGLRIGKPEPEWRPGQPCDERSEWDRDGQYFHYLTKWMQALHRAGQVTGDADFNRMARELAHTAQSRFAYRPPSGGAKRLYWKMSIDLSRPLGASMGQHDPLDGLITCYELCENAQANDAGCALQAEIDEFAPLCRNRDWTTDDPLGLGGLLADALRIGLLTIKGAIAEPWILAGIISSARAGLELFLQENTLTLPAPYRLAFREFGLSIGLRAAGKLKRLMADNRSVFNMIARAGQLEGILRFEPLARTIEDFWLEPANQCTDTWAAHRDINDVMLATSLAPDGYLAS